MVKLPINENFFKIWSPEMSYILGYIVADGCILRRKEKKSNIWSLNITSSDKPHLFRIRKALNSAHKIGRKPGGNRNIISYQIQVNNPAITEDLMNLGILPRKTYNLSPINVPDRYFPDFVRGFFDGDGTVYICQVNGVPQIKASFNSASFPFITRFEQDLCKGINVPLKTIHEAKDKRRKIPFYYIDFYIDDCEKLAKFMYGNNPTLYLPRKRQIFKRWKSIKRRHYIKQNYPSKIGWQLNQKAFASNN